MSKPTIPEYLAYFKAYHAVYPSWGSLHIVLDDNNVENSSVEFCVRSAKEKGDEVGEFLAGILLQMSKTQRLKLGRIA